MNRHPIAGFSAWCAAAIFLGALLVFQVQPIISKMILPWFGGTPAVWTTCLLFFQVVLLAGYAYADVLVRIRRPSRQAMLHLLLVLAAAATLPMAPSNRWKPLDPSHPTARILLLLAAAVGLPYLVLAATSPLVQAWFSRAYPNRSPYRLYALSNVGSLLALLTYPVLVERLLDTPGQDRMWSLGFAGYAALCIVLAVKLRRFAAPDASPRTVPSADADGGPDYAVGLRVWAAWLALPALGSVLLLAVTNHLCQNVAVIPLLWVVPLALYLLSFIICFDRPQWYVRRWFGLAAAASVLAASYLAMAPYWKSYFDQRGYGWQWTYVTKHVLLHATVYLTTLFLLCMVCHGELVRRRPPANRLTAFYLAVAGGGALGGVAVALVCPLVFSTFFELRLALVAGFVLALAAAGMEAKRYWLARASRLLRVVAGAAAGVLLAIVAWAQMGTGDLEPALVRARDFYGTLAVKRKEHDDPALDGIGLYHGDTLHGYQLAASDKRRVPTSYYTEQSGVGLVLRRFRADRPRRVGAVGLGAGTIAAYANQGDTFEFYELCPLVWRLAEDYFSFLEDARRRGARIRIELGDGRLALERQPARRFDVLVLDAFSGDSIPVHLLTREAFRLYLRHLDPQGVLCVHVSNRYLALAPVVLRIAAHYGLNAVIVRSTEHQAEAVAPCEWVLLSRNVSFFQDPAIRDAGQPAAADPAAPLWTDQYSSLLQVLR